MFARGRRVPPRAAGTFPPAGGGGGWRPRDQRGRGGVLTAGSSAGGRARSMKKAEMGRLGISPDEDSSSFSSNSDFSFSYPAKQAALKRCEIWRRAAAPARGEGGWGFPRPGPGRSPRGARILPPRFTWARSLFSVTMQTLILKTRTSYLNRIWGRRNMKQTL